MKRFKAATMDKTSPLKMKCQVKSKFDKENKTKSCYEYTCKIQMWRNVNCVDVLDPVGASSAISSVLIFCGADDRSLQHQRSPWHWLSEQAVLTALLCNANTSTWAGPSRALPVHLYSVSLPQGTLTHTVPVPHAATLIWWERAGLKTNRVGCLMRW